MSNTPWHSMAYSEYFQENQMVREENIDRGKVKDKIRLGLNCGETSILQ